MRRNEGSVLIWLSLLTEPGLSYSMDNRAFPSAGFISADESMFSEEHCMPANCQYPLRNYRRSYLMKTNKYTRVDKRIPHQHLRDLYRYQSFLSSTNIFNFEFFLDSSCMDSFFTLAAFSSAPVSSEETQVPIDQESCGGNANCYCVIA
ncbi:hypothetical protein BDR07DRAFT_1035339 [Suillus spraguei]|nr:hypothetical protein BDR07DRAFT_1035339 [Suillus spraguei]